MATPDLHDTFKGSELRKALDCIERHRANLEHEGIQVPGICVAGSQSAGKSSVLESISGIRFPSGDTMCTRCPCVVSLEQDDSVEEPTAVLATDPSYAMDRVECSLPDVGQHIKRLTDILAPDGQLTRKPMYMKITKKECPTLTLTDLPGITCFSNFQENIEDETVGLTEDYMKNPATIMLVVIPGSEDFNNPKALRLAKDNDPGGARTIGVVTKVDGLPAGTDILEKIRMERVGDVRVEQGFIAVRNRLKEETDLSPEAVWEKERLLFTTHPTLSQLSPSQWGIGTLTQKIVDIQTKLVGNFTFSIKATLRQKIATAKAELDGLEMTYVTDDERRERFMSIILQLTGNVEDSVQGRHYSFDNNDPSLHISARSCELSEAFPRDVENELPAFLEDGFRPDLEARIKETRGVDLDNFMSGHVFKGFISTAFASPLANHSEKLKHDVHDLVYDVIGKLAKELCVGFPKLQGCILEVAQTILNERMIAVAGKLRDYLNAEQRRVFTQNHYYMDTLSKFKRALDVRGMPHEECARRRAEVSADLDFSYAFIDKAKAEFMSGTSNQQQGTREMQVSLHVYAKVVKKRVFDIVPMYVHDTLIEGVSAELAKKIMSRSASEPGFLGHAMSQDPEILRTRERKTHALKSLQAALADFMELRC